MLRLEMTDLRTYLEILIVLNDQGSIVQRINRCLLGPASCVLRLSHTYQACMKYLDLGIETMFAAIEACSHFSKTL